MLGVQSDCYHVLWLPIPYFLSHQLILRHSPKIPPFPGHTYVKVRLAGSLNISAIYVA